ncbi:retrovirus-related pol polyprotein from transposon TNT 1-94 [Tanacetum coccineum]
MIELPLVDSGFVVPVFSPGDDPIACLNKAMAFLTAVASSRFPSTNNQLRTSSNPRNHATIQDGRVIVQQVQGRQGQTYSGTGYKSNATSSGGNNASGQARVVKCYNCQGEGHMARQCTQPKRPRNAAWYKDKAMLAKAQKVGQILDEEQLVIEQLTARSGWDLKMAELLASAAICKNGGVTDWYQRHGYREQDNMNPSVFSPFYNNPYLKNVQAFYAKELPISPPDPITSPAILTSSPVLPPSLLFDPRYFFVPEELLPPKKRIHSPSPLKLHKMYLKHHEKQVKDILNYLDELYLHRIERMEEGRINELLSPKKRICSTSSSSTTSSNSSRNQTCDLVSSSFSVYTPTPPQIFEIGKSSVKMHLKHHEGQNEDILNYLDELSFYHVEKIEEGRINDRTIIRRNSDELKTELKKVCSQIIELQKKQLGQRDKIAFAHYRISDLEQIIKEIQARHQTDQEDL